MNWNEFAGWGRRISDWAQNYHETLRQRPVRSRSAPGDLLQALPEMPPEVGTDMKEIFADFEQLVMPGLTHWQHPRFFAYFPANAAPPSVLAEFIASAVAPQCMLWQTSPAATEMETRMMDWLRQSLGLPAEFQGVIQDSASSATLAAVLTMRERALTWTGNSAGLSGQKRLRIYCSGEVHTSVDRAIWVSGIGDENLVHVSTSGPLRGMDPVALDQAIRDDLAAGFTPAGVILCVGATGTGATDPIADCIEVAHAHGLYTHVDAAWAGAAMICEELRTLWSGVDAADSIVMNPHKWLGAQFDCSAHFLRDPGSLRRTLSISPEYLRTPGQDDIVNYSEWSVPLGRRFRALKLWFLLRSYGLQALRSRIRDHIRWSGALCERLAQEPDFEIVTDPVLSLWTFRHRGPQDDHDAHNLRLIQALNDDGRLYLTQTRVDGRIAIRFQVGAFETREEDVAQAFDIMTEVARSLR